MAANSLKKDAITKAENEWIVWVRREDGYTLGPWAKDSRAPGRSGYDARPATASEIKAVRKKKEAEQAEAGRLAAFNSRPDVCDAGLVRDAIDLRIEKVVDRLTPEEWRELAHRLGAGGNE